MQNLLTHSLLTEYRTVLRYTCNNDLICVRKKSMAFIALILMQLRNA